jgi:hypothetical protein
LPKPSDEQKAQFEAKTLGSTGEAKNDKPRSWENDPASTAGLDHAEWSNHDRMPDNGYLEERSQYRPERIV